MVYETQWQVSKKAEHVSNNEPSRYAVHFAMRRQGVSISSCNFVLRLKMNPFGRLHHSKKICLIPAHQSVVCFQTCSLLAAC